MANVKRTAGKSIYIQSQPSDRMCAWHVRDFVRALDEYSIPDDAEVIAHKNISTLHTTGLSSQHHVQTDEDRRWIDAETEAASDE